MPFAPPPQQRRARGTLNELHRAVTDGCIERTLALLSSGSIDIDQRDVFGRTLLTHATERGHAHIVRILLDKGADVSVKDALGYTTLHHSAGHDHLAVAELLMKAGSDLEAAATSDGFTPLHVAAMEGNPEVMEALIEAGANANSRLLIDGATPLLLGAENIDVVKLLLRAKADPLLPRSPAGHVPLDVAAENGKLDVVGELIQWVGLEGCGGATGGVRALCLAAQKQHVDVMATLVDAGVLDTFGEALFNAALFGAEEAVMFLLQQRENDSSVERASYVSMRDASSGHTTLVNAFECARSSVRIVRLLIDAGADTTSAVRLSNIAGEVVFNDTPLALAELYLREKILNLKGEDATEAQLQNLAAIRGLLLRVEAVHAVSWQWHNEAPSTTHAVVAEDSRRSSVTSTPLTVMLPILRRRTRRPKVLLSALFRWVMSSVHRGTRPTAIAAYVVEARYVIMFCFCLSPGNTSGSLVPTVSATCRLLECHTASPGTSSYRAVWSLVALCASLDDSSYEIGSIPSR